MLDFANHIIQGKESSQLSTKLWHEGNLELNYAWSMGKPTTFMKKHGLATLDEVMLIAILLREGEFATSDAAYTAWLMPSIRKLTNV